MEDGEAELSPETPFDLSDEILAVLPSDPFAQLDVARKITSLALATRVAALESEADDLRHQLSDKDLVVDDLSAQIESLDSALSDANDKLAAAEQEKEALLKDNAQLSNTVKKLNRDVSKLEVFRKTLMQSLKEDEDGSSGVEQAALKRVSSPIYSSTQSVNGDDESVLPPSAYSSMQSQISEPGASYGDDRDSGGSSRPVRMPSGLVLASQTSTPRFTPPGSPPAHSASSSPKTSKPSSPKRHSMSFSIARGPYEAPPFPPSARASFSSYDGGAQARTRVDGKEFFRQVRSRLSYEQFGAFLGNVKELNSHKQSKEETLRKAEEIFGAENNDLYRIFEGLLSRNST